MRFRSQSRQMRGARALSPAGQARQPFTGTPRTLTLLAATLWLPQLWADPVDVINTLRMEGCGNKAAIGTSVTPRPALDSVARQLERNDKLEDAFELVGYPAANATSFHVRGARDDTDVRQILSARYCDSINDPRYREIGVFARGTEAWIVLAVSQAPEVPLDETAVAARVLALVNEARAQARRCGRERFAATAPLTLSATLNTAASGHAWDMAARGSAGHRGADGSLSGDRITRAGYTWRASGENVAAGQPDADTVVTAWLESPGHCVNLMAPYYTEMGIAFAVAPSKDPAIYWVQVFAAPL